ncbi:adenosylcobinamide-GDP ribazoletransferase [Roseibium sp. RKSG952]|uniref:adenosylcobinamide-GDP ribazoletransferase n=1 Tax=Roseibium sp. RKSG952 TaxID=2529384 RepID=UPI001AD8E81E
MFNRSKQTDKTLKGLGVHKNDTTPFSAWDIPLALVLLTRLPLPRLPEQVFTRQAQAAWAFPLSGLFVGLIACAIGWLAMALNLPVLACATLLVAVLVATTGAMHEDGLADTFDGLWGGFAAERRLEIMKDSHIGTYGVLALGIAQLLRISAVMVLLSNGALTGILAACVVSRASMPLLMSALPNARKSGLSHSVGAPSSLAVVSGLGIAVILALLLIGTLALLPALCAFLAAGILAVIAKVKIGGQTGDILGASQQVSEITFLLALAALI